MRSTAKDKSKLTVPDILEYRALHPLWDVHNGGRPLGNADDTVSVITVTYNSATTLECTIASVVLQTHPDVEYILVDGASKDGTLSIIRRHEGQISRWLSAPDEGISDAFNKGISLARGSFVAIVNSDDRLSPDNLRYAVETLRSSNADFVFGDQIMRSLDGSTFMYKGDPGYARLIRRRMPALNHPTVVVRKEAYERAGLFVKRLRYAMDFELLLRFHLCGMRGVYDPRILGEMALAGASDRNYIKGLAECREISIAHGLNAVRGWTEYLYSVAKGYVRRNFGRFLPASIINWLWSLTNRQFASR